MTSPNAPLLDVYAVRDENGAPALGDAVLVVGDGTVKVEFKHGHAKVEESVAHLIRHRTDLNIPALTGVPEPAEPAATTADQFPADVEYSDTDQLMEKSPEEDPRVQAAREHLAGEGEEVPEPVKVPAGFELRTADGSARCIAAKADGSQCANPAKDGSHACALSAHQERVAAL